MKAQNSSPQALDWGSVADLGAEPGWASTSLLASRVGPKQAARGLSASLAADRQIERWPIQNKPHSCSGRQEREPHISFESSSFSPFVADTAIFMTQMEG
jgi:hypothetical protein